MSFEQYQGGEQVAPIELDLSTDYWTEQLASAPIYEKTAQVRIRAAAPGEVVSTVLADGTVETVNTAGENQVVITNPGGEEYIVDAAKASKRYAPTDIEGVYKAVGMVRALDNPTGADIAITAPWGERQVGGPDCKIAALYSDEEADVVSGDRYIIGAVEFAETYGRRIEETESRRKLVPAWLTALFVRQPKTN